VLEGLLALTQDASDNVRGSAADALGNLGVVAATLPVLERLLVLGQDTNDDVRRSAVGALGKLDWTFDPALAHKLEAFWEKCLPENKMYVSLESLEVFGNFAYRQLQRIAARQAQSGAASSKAKKFSNKPASRLNRKPRRKRL
jgi:HEAT repeat protein